MFDKFQPFQRLQMQNFSFTPNKYEIWERGKMTKNGMINTQVFAKIINQDNSQKMEISFDDLSDEICKINVFDILLTQTDRLQFLIIPNRTNAENMAIMTFKMVVGATREQKNFQPNEPYCCNLFLQNGIIKKLTFSFSKPEKLIELYS